MKLRLLLLSLLLSGCKAKKLEESVFYKGREVEFMILSGDCTRYICISTGASDRYSPLHCTDAAGNTWRLEGDREPK